MRSGLAWFVGWLVLTHALTGAAQPSPAPAAEPAPAPAPAPAPDTTGRWYGWQILVADIASLGLGLAIGAASDDHGNRRFGDVIGSAWGFGTLGSLSIHAAHENGAIGAASVGHRLLMPPLVSVVGLGFGCLLSGIADNCASDSARWSFAIGGLGAIALDAGLLARERPHDRHHWYGWQTLIIDGAALTAGIAVIVRRNEPNLRKRIGGIAVLPYLTGILISPWVHAFHGRWGTAFGSLGLRAFGPALGALAGLSGYCAATGGADACIGDGAVYGLLGGTVIVSAIDIGLLAQERVEPAAGASAAFVVPYAAPRSDGFSAGMAGAF